jgi:glutamyl-tRNA synthetase
MKAGGKPRYDGTCRERNDQPDAPFVVRFKTPHDGNTAFVDRIKGTISVENNELDDLIIQRTDGNPTYNFVVVIDDAEMGINLVIRGDDHVNNTVRQIPMYKALGYEVPEFAHVPMILGADKKRLSKRHGATSVMVYKEMGFLPEAMVNYLVRLGWSFGDEEVFSMADLITKFSLDNVGRSAGVFNPDKLLWLNEHYIKTGDPVRLAGLVEELLAGRGVEIENGPDMASVVKTLQERAKTLVEMADGAQFYFVAPEAYDEASAAKFLTEEQRPVLELLIKHLGALSSFDLAEVESAFKALMAESGLKLGKIGPVVRVALTGGTVSPSIYDVVSVLGQETVLARIKKALAYLD